MSAMYQRDGGRLTDRQRRAFALPVSRLLEALATDPAKGGRPPIELPPDVARAVLNDVANAHSAPTSTAGSGWPARVGECAREREREKEYGRCAYISALLTKYCFLSR